MYKAKPISTKKMTSTHSKSPDMTNPPVSASLYVQRVPALVTTLNLKNILLNI